MAKTEIAHKNGRGDGPQFIRNSSVAEVLDDADRILEMVLMDNPPVATAHTGQRQNNPRATGQRPHKRTSEDRRRSSSPLEAKEASKKRKNALEDDGSRHRDDNDDDDDDAVDDGSGGHSKSKRDEEPVEKTRGGDARKLTVAGVGRRAPLAEPEDSTVTPEPEHDVDWRMRLLKCRSQSEQAPEGDDVDGDERNAAEEEYDVIDGKSDEEEPIDEKERVIQEIAMKLRNLGDALNSQIAPGTMTKSVSTLSISMGIEGIQDLISNLTYEQFQDAVNKNMGNETGVQQVTVMFRLASAAVRHLGSPAAGKVKQIALDYFRNNVANWVSQNGGWEGIAQRL